MLYYMCKFIPPRSDFLSTLSEDEHRWMREHGAFLTTLLEQGVILAHGPVIDETGGFGLSLYRLSDDQKIEDFTSNDPIVRHGIGRYEHFVMPTLAIRSVPVTKTI